MLKRPFGATGLHVSERSFGAWAIGGKSFGAVDPTQALDALACAEDLGCNLVDTAAVYGDSEAILGRFLVGRRDRWIVASKYSGQEGGLTALVEEQLRRLNTDRIDFYQLHWAPRGKDEQLYEELERVKRAGKIRFCGVSLRSAADVDSALSHPCIDGLQFCVSLLDPGPLVERLGLLRERKTAVIARSALRGGFLTGKYDEQAEFKDRADQRHEWSRSRIRELAQKARAFKFLTDEGGSLLDAAIAYPLSFAEVSTVVISCKNAQQVHANLESRSRGALDAVRLRRVDEVQRELGVFPVGRAARLWRRMRRAISNLGG